MKIPDEHLKIELCDNKLVRVTHLPSGIYAECSAYHARRTNRTHALDALERLVYSRMYDKLYSIEGLTK